MFLFIVNILKFFLNKYSIIETIINNFILKICDKGYIKISLILSIIYSIYAIIYLYIFYLLLIFIILIYYIIKLDFNNLIIFFYKHVFLKILFLIIINFINYFTSISIYFLYRVFLYLNTNKMLKPFNLVSFIIYIGEFIRKPVNELKEKNFKIYGYYW